MIFLVSAWLALTFILGLVAHFAIWARTGQYKPRLLSVVAFFIGSLVSAAILLFSVGWSIPCSVEMYFKPGKYTVIGFQAIQNDKIHLFLDTPDSGPKLCYIPYSTESAQKLQDGMDGNNPDANGVDLEISGMHGRGDNNEMQLWPKPPTPENAPKPEEQQHFLVP
jgi:hypothetical protein